MYIKGCSLQLCQCHLNVIENIYYGLSNSVNSKDRIDSLINDYNIDICCLQETKMKAGVDTTVGESRLICFPTTVTAYGMGLKEFKFIRKHSELLCSHGDLTTLRDEAMNRDNWKRLVENITYAAEATRPVSGIEA